jgi:hypothetical protein
MELVTWFVTYIDFFASDYTMIVNKFNYSQDSVYVGYITLTFT